MVKRKYKKRNGSWNKGKRLSEEHKCKLRESHKGMIPWNKGKKASEETKKKLSLSHIGIFHSEETRKKMSKNRKGITWEELYGIEKSKELKIKISNIRKGMKFSEEHKRNIRLSHIGIGLGKHLSEESKRKISESKKGHIVTEKQIIKSIKTFKKNYKKENHPFYNKKHNESSKSKMSLSHRKEKTWCWKGGISQNYYKRLIEYLGLKNECSKCKSKNYVIIHHKNRNRKDNNLENLQILCRKCHSIEHQLGKYKRNKSNIQIKNV